MIVFDLRCSSGHVFEAWFGSGAAFEDQCARGLLACPVCGDGAVTKAVMAPNIAAKGNRAPVATPRSMPPAHGDAPPSPDAVKAALHTLARAQAEMLAKSEWVGRSFADRARAMHAGEESPAPIYGATTPGEAKALVEEGVPVAPLPLPVIPPEALN